MDLFSRTKLVFGEDGVEKLSHAKVLIVGLGGVGGAALEMIARTGIRSITMVDGDRFSESNLNRQLGAIASSVGCSKAETWLARCREINPAGDFYAENHFLKDDAEIKELLSRGFDVVIDAIDDVKAKTRLLYLCAENHVFTVSSMGAGGKREIAPITVSDISRTHGCPLARIIRKNLRDLGVKHGIRAVFSPETAVQREAGAPVGSISYVVASFGLYLAKECVDHILLSDR